MYPTTWRCVGNCVKENNENGARAGGRSGAKMFLCLSVLNKLTMFACSCEPFSRKQKIGDAGGKDDNWPGPAVHQAEGNTR